MLAEPHVGARGLGKLEHCVFSTLALCAALSGCDGGGGGLDAPGSNSPAVNDIIPLEPEPRVDLPGRISVFFQVVGGNGNAVADLTESDFQLFENGNPVSGTESQQRLLPKPRVFRSYSHILLDRSGSIAQSADGMQQEIDATIAYIEIVTQAPESFVRLSWFDGDQSIRPVLLDDFSPLGFTNDRELLIEGIRNLHDQAPASTSTNLYGAILEGLEDLDLIDVEAEGEGIDFRSLTLVAFTDGTDQAGVVQFEEALERIQEKDPTTGVRRYAAYTIGLGDEINNSVLKQLGPEGSVFAPSFDDLNPKFEEIGSEVRNLANSFYFLSYCSPKQNGSGSHVLTVRATEGGKSAEEDYLFDADWFSGGCGFLDIEKPMASQSAFTVGDMIEDDQGRVLVCGSYQDMAQGESTLFVTRLRPDGKRDRGFANEGILAVEDQGSLSSLRAESILVDDSDGSILVGGVAGNGDLETEVTRAAVWRFEEDGVLRDLFVIPQVGSDGDELHDMALDSKSRLVVVGSAGIASPQTAVWRFDSFLAPDTGLKNGGLFLHANDPSLRADIGLAVVINAIDRIFVAGTGYSPSFSGPDFKLLKLRANGSLDPGFGTGGVVGSRDVFSAAPPGYGHDLALDSQDRVVVGGVLRIFGRPEQPALWRFRDDGTPDTAFLGDPSSTYFGTGLVTLPEQLLDDVDVDFGDVTSLHRLVVHADDSVLAAGSRRNAELHADLASWRFDDQGMLSAAYNGTGFLIDDGAGGDDSNDEGRAILIHSDGRIWMAGTTIVAEGAETTAEQAELAVWIDREFERVFAPTGAN